MTLLIHLDSSLPHSNKESETSSLNGAAYQSCRRQSTALNPYVTRKKVPTKSSIAFSMTSLSMASSASLVAIEEDTSPTIRQILEETGCSSRQELLAVRAEQEANPNGSKSTNTNGRKAAPKGPKSTTNGAKATATSGYKVPATNGTKSTNGSKFKTATNRNGSTNPKKNPKSKQFY